MKDVEDIMIGCAFPEAEQGLNIGRIASQIAGFPVDVSGAHGKPILRLRSRSHRLNLVAGDVRMVGCCHWRRPGIYDVCSQWVEICQDLTPEHTPKNMLIYTFPWVLQPRMWQAVSTYQERNRMNWHTSRI